MRPARISPPRLAAMIVAAALILAVCRSAGAEDTGFGAHPRPAEAYRPSKQRMQQPRDAGNAAAGQIQRSTSPADRRTASPSDRGNAGAPTANVGINGPARRRVTGVKDQGNAAASSPRLPPDYTLRVEPKPKSTPPGTSGSPAQRSIQSPAGANAPAQRRY